MKIRWSSQLGYIFATVGAAVGLGNIWKFPYTAGQNGGGAFLVLYIGLVFLVGLPALLAEAAIGRSRRENTVDSLCGIAQSCSKTKAWGLLGWWGALGLVLILSFYSVVSGWSVAYLWRTINGVFSGADVANLGAIWGDFIQNPWELLVWHFIFMGMTAGIVVLGVRSGIERATSILMPALFFLLLGLVAYNYIDGGGFAEASNFLFSFNWENITSGVVIAALGQALFSQSTGVGCMLIYGAYTGEKTNLAQSAFVITLINIFIAILAGFAIFPVTFKHGLAPAEGPNLMFNTLPLVFGDLSYGVYLGAAFFLLLFFAALTSSVSLLEPLVVLFVEKLRVSRLAAVLSLSTVALILGVGSILSFNSWEHIDFWGERNFFELVTDFSTNIILPTGGFLFSVFAGWVMPDSVLRKALGVESSSFLYFLWRGIVRWLIPVAILIILIAPLI